MTAQAIDPNFQLPWSSSEADDRRFLRLLRIAFVVFIVIAMVIPLIPLPTQILKEHEEKPRRLARILMEKKELPTTEQTLKKKDENKKEKAVKPKPVKPVKEAKDLSVQLKPEKKSSPKTKVVDELTVARETAKGSGVLAFQDDLMDMRDSLHVGSLGVASPSQGSDTIAKVERSIIVGMAGKSGRGIAVSTLSRNTGSSALPARETTKVENTAAVAVSKLYGEKSGNRSGRSDGSIRREMDKNKGKIFTIYNRALRKDPSLQGRFVFEMIIAPSGQVVNITLISSQLGDESLNKKILTRVKLIFFGDKDVSETVVNYSFDFLPA